MQGRDLPFGQRQTGNPEFQLSYQTSIKYWRFLSQFFAWAAEDRLVADNPALVAAPIRPKGVKAKSPDPFSTQELQTLFAMPLFAGHKSPKRLMEPGTCRSRGGQWWSAVLFLHTGLRAGELSQLMPSDFDFDAEIPHLKVRETAEEGVDKSVKNRSSIREVPLHPDLFTLGLRQFVERQRKRGPKVRVFDVFRLGIHRKSEGATRFWGDFIKASGLHKPGRSTHVWRHTFIAALRHNQVPVEDIAALAGHSGGERWGNEFSQTKAYGGDYSLARKRQALLKLDYGFDAVTSVGGPYIATMHRV